MKITIIGSGNVATVLGRLFRQEGHTIEQLHSRNESTGKELAGELSAAFVQYPQQLTRTSDIYIVAISDDALYELKNWLKLKDQLIVHTAGSVSIEVLKECSFNYGILYPLQSLRKEIPIPPIPFLVDGNNEKNIETIFDLLSGIAASMTRADDEQRKKLHLSAVMVNNFTNHLFALTEDYCRSENIDFSLLHPLLKETVSRLSYQSAKTLQTGPAARNDEQTIQKQRDMLEAYPHLLAIYNVFTRSISATPNAGD